MSERPEPTVTAADWLARVKALERVGDYIQAYDTANHGLEEHPDDLALHHRAVLNLVRSGGIERASEELVQRGLDAVAVEGPLGEDIAALAARIAKDRALAVEGEARRALAREARDLYLAIHARTGGYYPGINAATLSLLAGEEARARELAEQVVAACAAERGREGESYYLLATEAEAALLRGEPALAREKLAAADALSRGDDAARATTRRQLRRICEARGLPLDILDAIEKPWVIHYTGHMIARPGEPGRLPAAREAEVAKQIADYLEAKGVDYGFGSLACGSDILFVEALLARGAEVHVVLPFGKEDFVETSVRRGGEQWVGRFEACLENDKVEVSYASSERFGDEVMLYHYASRLATGLALLRARNLDADLDQVAVWDGRPATGKAGTAADIELWKSKGLGTTVIDPGGPGEPPSPEGEDRTEKKKTQPFRNVTLERAVRAMLFGDVKGFSGLSEGQIPVFLDEVMGSFGRVIDGYGDRVLQANTWGDGIYIVLEDAQTAAECALELQRAMHAIDLEAHDLPPHLDLRIGGHVGPVFEVYDPVVHHRSFCGTNVTRTARIEPVTPPGEVFVTEQMAAALALDGPPDQVCEYVGHVPSAKGYGDMRMYVLKRRTA